MDSGFRRRETANNEVRLGYLDNDGDGPIVVALHGGTRPVILAGGSHDAHLDATPEWAAALSLALKG